jgi:hypothetical protein
MKDFVISGDGLPTTKFYGLGNDAGVDRVNVQKNGNGRIEVPWDKEGETGWASDIPVVSQFFVWLFLIAAIVMILAMQGRKKPHKSKQQNVGGQ